MNRRLIGMHGLPRSGKDTLADEFVAREGFVKMAFADPLYQEVSDAWGVPIEALRHEEWKGTPQSAMQLGNCTNPDFIKLMRKMSLFLDEPVTSRRALQLWATEFRRHLYGNDYWVGKMIGRLRQLHTEDVILSDIREDVEAAMGHWKVTHGRFTSFKIIEVLRQGTAITGHSSDVGLSRFLIDVTVRSEGSVEELYNKAVEALAKGQEERKSD